MKVRKPQRTKRQNLFKLAPSKVFPDGAFEIRYRDTQGRPRRKRFDTRQEALDFEAEVRRQKKRGQFIDPRMAKTPFSEVAEAWYVQRETVGLTKATLYSYRTILDAHLLPRFGRQAVGNITVDEIQAFIGKAGLAANTQRNIKRVMSAIFKLAIQREMIHKNPCDDVRLRRQDMAPEIKPLTAKEIEQLAQAVPERYKTLVYFAAYTGMRAGEITALRVRHLDLLHGRVTVEESTTPVAGELTSGPTKNRRRRKVVLADFLVPMLQELVEGKGPDDHLFNGSKGGAAHHANFYARHFKPAVKRLVKKGWRRELADLRFHDLRHTAASLLIRQGLNPKLVSQHLGHSSVQITLDRYGHMYPGDEANIVDALNAVHASATEEDEQVISITGTR